MISTKISKQMTTLLELWKDKRDFFVEKTLSQIISMTGEGALKDGNKTSLQIREFLNEIPTRLLVQYANQCLDEGFKDSGLALQDVINQFGKRLGFEIEQGVYRGKKNEIGFDGIWSIRNDHSFIVEIKTTDAYRINMDIVAGYKEKLADQNRIDKNRSSILLIVGRQDTGDLEAQIRGSRHSWNIRLISIVALTKLLELRETVNDIGILRQINELLKPLEYTRLDRLIELIFITSQDTQYDSIDDQIKTLDEMDTGILEDNEEKNLPVNYHQACIEKISKHLSKTFIQQSKTTYQSIDNTIGLTCAVSKIYPKKHTDLYWYAFHPHHKEFLGEFKQS
jgi:hypothetical protein